MATATILLADWETQGDWIGTYGAEGCILPGSVAAPAWLAYSLSYSGLTGYTPDPGDRRQSLAPPSGSARIGQTYNDGYQVGATLTPSDGADHWVAISARVGGDATPPRRCRIDVLDASTSAVLATYTVDREYVSGVWLFVRFAGAITINVVKTDAGTSVQSAGLLFGPVQSGRIAALSPINSGILA